MAHPETRISRWRTAGSIALATAAVAFIGFTTVAPAKADYDDWRWRHSWHQHEWREHHRYRSYGYYSSPSYSYYSYYPSYSYPSYGYGYSYPSYSYYPYGGSDYGYEYSR